MELDTVVGRYLEKSNRVADERDIFNFFTCSKLCVSYMSSSSHIYAIPILSCLFSTGGAIS